MTLISLVSKQIWPQVLVAAHFKPTKITLVHTRDDAESFGPARRIQEFFHRHATFFGKPNISLLEVPHDRFEKIGSRLDGIIDRPTETVLHITGGNKLMSTAAFEKARLIRCPALYLERGNTLVEFRYEGEARSVRETLLDASICNGLDAADLCGCQLAGNKISGRGERLVLNRRGRAVLIGEVSAQIRDSKKNPARTATWLKNCLEIKVFSHCEPKDGDPLEYGVALVLLKLGVEHVYRSIVLLPDSKRATGPEGELDLVFNHNGALWVVDCKDKTSALKKLDQAVTKLVKEGLTPEKAKKVLEPIARDLQEKEIKILREDLQQTSESGGLLGRCLAVRAEGLPEHVREYAESRRPKVEVIYKNELEGRLRALLFPNRSAEQSGLAALAGKFSL